MSHVQALYDRRNAARAAQAPASPTKEGRGELKRSVQGAVGGRVPMSALRTPSASSVARLAELGVSSEPIHDERPETFSLDVVSDTEVVMTPPHEMSARTASRLRGQAVPAKYTFSKVFSRPEADAPMPAAMQSQFFQETTLPLVRDLLEGRNSLVFTYGVTNSGKTYTVQGSQAPGEAGILPRAIDVIFNSTKGLECTKAIRPMGLTGVQPGVSDPSKSLLSFARKPRDVPALEVDPTCVPVSDEFRYSVWVSYVEVYNEKLYDLLDTPSASLLQREPRDDTGAARRPLLLKSEVESGGKYVSGLKEIKVSSIAEAKELLYRGQENRTVFSTMANRTSSRSHSVFTIKILREQTSVALEDRDIAGLSRKYFISRMSIVDLAGSERVANTEVPSGPRLKEAGNINKSLMCLGQCLETMRKNQIRAGIFHGERADASDSQSKPRRRQSIIPFRHSKLTELFQSFFTGDGRVVMIVNVNPYGTGFEESANVMRFSAMAKDVGIHVAPNERASPTKRSSSLPNTSGMTVLDAGDSDDEDEDPFVTMLIEENERLRNKCERAENLCMVIEKTVRDEMALHLESALRKMQLYYEEQLRTENDAFMGKKLDLFARFTAATQAQAADVSERACSDDVAVSGGDSAVFDSPVLAPKSTNTARFSEASADDSLLFQPRSPSPTRSTRKLRTKPVWNAEDIDAHLAENAEPGLRTPRRSARFPTR